jgi:hypothetical protein
VKKTFYKLVSHPEFKFDSQTYRMRNKTFKFMGTDTERLWKKNKNIKSLEYYKDNEIEYRLNNFGYRTPYDFKQGDEVNIFLGCSHTIGYGIELEKTWPYLLTQEIGGNIANLAVGGCSIDRQFRELYTWMNFFKIKNIFHFQPIYAREEFLNDKGYHKFSVQDSPIEILNNVKEEFLVDNFGSDVHIMRKYVTNILSIESISNRLGCDYYYIHELPEHDVNGIPARDNMHMDANGHKKIYKQFLEKYINKDNSKNLLEDDFNLEHKNNLI